MRIAYLTAGAAGMYCGSCMHDNALARALIARGAECLLVPVYTPIRTDDENVSVDRVFFGGINVYLQQKWPLLGRVPPPLLRLLDAPWLLRLATRRAGGTDAATLGELTVSMLRGTEGRQAGEVHRLVRWLADDFRPDVILLSNLLIGGCIPAIREAMKDVRIVTWLQGDDIFLEHLPSPYRERATKLLSELVQQLDGCLVNSRFYADKMQRMLSIPAQKIHIVPLAIDVTPFGTLERLEKAAAGGEGVLGASDQTPLRLGYFARLAPEKGFHHLVDTFIELAGRPSGRNAELHYAGWLGDQHRSFFEAARRQLGDAGLDGRHRYHGSPELQGKLDFLGQIDVLCVPTVYEEPKGLFVLEALAAGVPVVQPQHGAFPELLAATGGGLLVPPGDPIATADAIESLWLDPVRRSELGRIGREAVYRSHSITAQAERVEQFLLGLGEEARS